MIYDTSNVEPGTILYDVERLERLERVLRVDTDAATAECASWPIRADPKTDEVVTHTLRFRSIYPIHDKYRPDPAADRPGLPCMFHCYGRQEQGAQG